MEILRQKSLLESFKNRKLRINKVFFFSSIIEENMEYTFHENIEIKVIRMYN